MPPASPSAPPSTRPAVDSHAHVFEHGLALAAVPRYRPDHDALLGDYLAQLDANGLTHGVLVQPSFLGTENRYLLAALRAEPARLRGVAVVDPAIEDAELDAMAAAGVVGIRLNLIGLPAPDLGTAPWRGLLERIHARGWHVELHLPAARLQEVMPALLAAGCRIVVDHFGRPDPALGVADPGFDALLRHADSGRVWVKLSAAYRNWPDAQCAQAGRLAAQRLLEAFTAGRLLWGSDWPHTQHPHVSYGATRQWLDDWIDDAAQRRQLLGDTALNLFQFQGDSA
ncbi:amidohydrolase family protein [Cupriavidus cauae]|uniref:Amidohydrolase family protein n=1 Tax=Cupriavidus cauae TaxID=2608999 RepID=A0A5M8AH19_9BURK|nr:amidohydrolase family protein [Cupriavidus cauae]KAA6123167.1 amidohydrolase family protein [Cupriavidus cauae]